MRDPSELAGRLVSEHGVPGLAIGILDDGESATGSAGVVDASGGEPLSPDAVFRVASLTKPVVATLVTALAAEGLLDLDAPVVASLPRLAASWAVDRAITLRHLLSHQGGLAPDLEDMDRFGDDEGALDAAVEEIVCRRRQQTDPGRAWHYSNSGYWLAGLLAARALGSTFEDAVDAKVLAPLGMTATSFAEPPPGKQLALGHMDAAADGTRGRYPRARRPSGGLHSTTADLLCLALAVATPGSLPLTRETVAEMARPLTTTTWGTHYGLGWEVASPDGETILSHDGDWGGYRARLLIVPGRRLAFAALANAAAAGPAVDDVERALLRPRGLSRGSRVQRLAIAAAAEARYAAARARRSARRS